MYLNIHKYIQEIWRVQFYWFGVQMIFLPIFARKLIIDGLWYCKISLKQSRHVKAQYR